MAEIVIVYSGERVSRKDAKAKGLTRYFTGKPCPYGHIAQRMTSGTACVECLRLRRLRNPEHNYAQVKAWRAANPEKWAEQSRRYHERYPEKQRVISKRWRENNLEKAREQDARNARERRQKDPEGNKRRSAKFKALRELTLEGVAGRPRPEICEVCNEKDKIVFDHCHASEKFRGWICDRCNRVLGLVKDSQAILRGLADYLERANGEIDDKTKERSS